MTTLNFKGSGGLYHYYFGICACLQDELDISSLRFRTSSGSGFPVMLLCMGLPVRTSYRRWVSRSVAFFRTNTIRAWVSGYYDLVYGYCYEIGKLSQCPLWNHTIIATDPSGNKCEISSYSGIEDYANVATASAYIPLPWCRPFWYVRTRNLKLYDGSLGRQTQAACPGILVSTTSLSGNRAYGGVLCKWYYTLLGLVSDCDWMYDAGYSDATKFLLPKLIHVPRRQKSQVCSTDEHIIQYSRVALDGH